jgi:hypothetical protein
MTVIKNTYPATPGVAHAEVGDEVRWEFVRGHYSLVRISDGKTLYATGDIDKNGNLRSNGKPPQLTGVIASVLSKGWVLEMSK